MANFGCLRVSRILVNKACIWRQCPPSARKQSTKKTAKSSRLYPCTEVHSATSQFSSARGLLGQYKGSSWRSPGGLSETVARPESSENRSPLFLLLLQNLLRLLCKVICKDPPKRPFKTSVKWMFSRVIFLARSFLPFKAEGFKKQEDA